MEQDKLIKLVTAAQGGEQSAFSDLFNDFQNTVYNIALRETKDPETAADITQEVFIEVIQTIAKLQEPTAFVSWIKAITYHQCTRYYRKKETKHEQLTEDREDTPDLFAELEEENEEFIPDRALENEEFCKIIRSFIDTLPDAQRAAIMMKYFDDLSVKEIAAVQGVPEKTVISRLFYGRNAIKAEVEAYEKKHDTKLHAIPFLPLVRFLFNEAPKKMSRKAVLATAKAVGTATGVKLSVAGAGLVGTLATIPLAAKIGAGIAAAAIAVSTPLIVNHVNQTNTASTTTTTKTTATTILDDHQHTYTCISSAANCTQEGRKTYTCDCGHSYTESIPITHTWGPWAQITAPTVDAIGRGSHTCVHCGAEETCDVTIDQWFERYANDLMNFGVYFESTAELSKQPVDDVFCTLIDFRNHFVGPVETSPETYSIDDLDSFTKTYFGLTWDYSTLDGKIAGGMYQCTYNSENRTITAVSPSGWGGPTPYCVYKDYKQVDDTNFVITYDVEYEWAIEASGVTVEVEWLDDHYMVVAHREAPKTMEEVFEEYAEVALAFGSFDSVDALSAADVFFCATDFRYGQVTYSQRIEASDGTAHKYYDIVALDAYTQAYLGRTWDYSEITGHYDMYDIVYLAEENAVKTRSASGWGGPSTQANYQGYTQIDDTHFVIKSTEANPDSGIAECYITVELVDGHFYITRLNRTKISDTISPPDETTATQTNESTTVTTGNTTTPSGNSTSRHTSTQNTTQTGTTPTKATQTGTASSATSQTTSSTTNSTLDDFFNESTTNQRCADCGMDICPLCGVCGICNSCPHDGPFCDEELEW